MATITNQDVSVRNSMYFLSSSFQTKYNLSFGVLTLFFVRNLQKYWATSFLFQLEFTSSSWLRWVSYTAIVFLLNQHGSCFCFFGKAITKEVTAVKC